jgi:hypothetical protein
VTKPPLAGLAVAGLAALVVATGAATEPARAPATGPPPVTRSAVVSRLSVCPELLRSGDTVRTKLTAGTATPGQVGVRAAPLVKGGDIGPQVLDRGGVIGNFEKPVDQAIAVATTATGELAGAIETEQVSRGDNGIQRGLAGIRCESTQADTWFVGGATLAGYESELILVNPYDDPALVDVTVLGPKGAIGEEVGDADAEVSHVVTDTISVAGRARVPINLARIAPDLPQIAVHVVTRQGRIAPSLREARRHGRTPYGVDWVPRAGTPSPNVLLAGVPAGNGERLLYLVAPGSQDATVSVRVTNQTSFVPNGLDAVNVPAGRVKVVNLFKALGGVPSAVEVVSEGEPVLAGIYVENHARYNPIRETAYVGPTPTLFAPAVVSDNRVGGKFDTTFLLTAIGGPAKVRIRLLPVRGSEGAFVAAERVVTLPEGRAISVHLPGKVPKFAHVRPAVLEPVSGNFAGSRVLFEQGARGPLLTVLPLVAQPGEGVEVPAVQTDPRLTLP